MDNKKEYITIAEYANIKGVSKQAVYKQLNNKLKEFEKVVDGKKCLDIGVLTEVEQQKVNQVEQPLNNSFQPLLEKQIEEKDKTIQSLLRQVENLQEQNSRLTELLHNSQYLLAAEQRKALEAEKQPPQDIEEQPQETKTEKKGFFARLMHKSKKTWKTLFIMLKYKQDKKKWGCKNGRKEIL